MHVAGEEGAPAATPEVSMTLSSPAEGVAVPEDPVAVEAAREEKRAVCHCFPVSQA